MAKRVTAIGAIYVLVSVAWFLLAGSVVHRTSHTDGRLKGDVAALWGRPQTQLSPEAQFEWKETLKEEQTVEDPATRTRRVVTTEREVVRTAQRVLDRSHIDVGLDLEQRRKGLLWYSTYVVRFAGDYRYVHRDDREGVVVITYRFPTAEAIYDNFRFEVAGARDGWGEPDDEAGTKVIRQRIPVKKGDAIPFAIAYASRGMDDWRYAFGAHVNRVKDFRLEMTTSFRDVDYPPGTISPTAQADAGSGRKLTWVSENLISGFAVGMDMPRRLNPGPLAAEMSFFAPVSLAFFFIWMFVITLMKGIDLHPMNYLFLGAAFFAFHLLFAYSADHLDVVPAFLLSSAVTIGLVVSYLRLVVGMRFAAIEAGFSQLIYLVLFSYAHFFEGLTGLIVTVGSILTLFALMQLTGRIRWEGVFAKGTASG